MAGGRLLCLALDIELRLARFAAVAALVAAGVLGWEGVRRAHRTGWRDMWWHWVSASW